MLAPARAMLVCVRACQFARPVSGIAAASRSSLPNHSQSRSQHDATSARERRRGDTGRQGRSRRDSFVGRHHHQPQPRDGKGKSSEADLSPQEKVKIAKEVLFKLGKSFSRKRISGWDLDFQAFSNVEADDQPADKLALLMEQWYRQVAPSLQQALRTNSVNEHWDGNVLLSIADNYFASEVRRLAIVSFLSWIQGQAATLARPNNFAERINTLLSVADLRYPSLLYPEARTLTRNIHLHVGPTNSGKTHGALKALCNAQTGVYAGPLRLLAHEVWHRINSGTVSPGVPPRPCNLLTGEEHRMSPEYAGLLSCTVEMLSPNEIYDVAVVDEIQMIADPQRGFAWTSAVLGLAAKEIHLCGEKSVIPLIRKMAEACGDVVHVHEYERLTPLRTEKSIGSLKNVQKGDCVVAFSRTGLFEVKDTIERTTGLKCAIAYGALPPETKAEQARLFNDPANDVDVMVASDAIGMGLNLKIKRVVFTTVSKWNGKSMESISDSQIKQIAGRAGRYDSNADGERAGGTTTTLRSEDLPVLERALASPLKPITHAAIQADAAYLEKMATVLKGTAEAQENAWQRPVAVMRGTIRPLRELYLDLGMLTRIDPTMYFADDLESQTEVASLIQDAVLSSSNLTLAEQDTFSKAPIQTKDAMVVAFFSKMLRMYAQGQLVDLAKAERGLGMFNVLDDVRSAQTMHRILHSPDLEQDGAETEAGVKPGHLHGKLQENMLSLDINSLMTLESLHRGITLYMWLSMRFPTAFCYREKVEELRVQTESAIDFVLRAIRANRQARLEAMGKGSGERGERQSRPSGKKSRFGELVDSKAAIDREEEGADQFFI